MEWLPLLGIALTLVVVFVWRRDTLTGVFGVVLGVTCADWLLKMIRGIDLAQAWGASPVPRVFYYVLVAVCGLIAALSFYFVVAGLIHLVQSRLMARTLAADIPGQRAVTAMRSCPHCGGRISVQAIACKHCEKDVRSAG